MKVAYLLSIMENTAIPIGSLTLKSLVIVCNGSKTIFVIRPSIQE